MDQRGLHNHVKIVLDDVTCSSKSTTDAQNRNILAAGNGLVRRYIATWSIYLLPKHIRMLLTIKDDFLGLICHDDSIDSYGLLHNLPLADA